MRILQVHGWALGPWIWQSMNRRLQALLPGESLELTVADLGFFGDLQLPEGKFDLAIGHSFGLLWLLETPRISFDRLISINGFTRFSPATDFQAGWPVRVLQRMRKQLAVDSRIALQQFWEKLATDPCPPGPPDAADPDVARLDWALEALIKGDGREQWSRFPGPRRAIAATRDTIVSLEHTQHCFVDSDVQWLKSECHCLPLKFPEICAALVRELIEVS